MGCKLLRLKTMGESTGCPAVGYELTSRGRYVTAYVVRLAMPVKENNYRLKSF
jgi:hypothetical protein